MPRPQSGVRRKLEAFGKRYGLLAIYCLALPVILFAAFAIYGFVQGLLGR